MKRTPLFAILVASLTSLSFLAGSAIAQTPTPTKPADPPKAAEQPKKDEPKKDDEKAKPTTPTTSPENKTVAEFEFAKLSTSKGDIILKLNKAKAPISVDNFLKYVDKKFYDGTIFHRVIPNFMIQGGGFTPDMKQKPTDSPIKNEWKNGLQNKKYTLAMARTSVPDSGTSQFFINTADNAFLDQARDGAAYAVFGEVAAGKDVVDAIGAVKTGNKGGMGDVPTETVTINSVTRISEDDAKKAGAK